MLSLPKVQTLDPIDFCRKYARKQEGEWGYKASWRALLAYVCGVSDSAVQQWGKDFENCPERHRRHLCNIHALKEAEKALRAQGLDGPLQ